MFSITGQYVAIADRKIFPAKIAVENGKIRSVLQVETAPQQYILPGFIDAHIHIESSMLTPFEFAKIAVTHGTVATVSDPHEIANVCGVAGIDYMIENARHASLKFNFGAPSCVPATGFETAGAILDSKAIDELLQRDSIKYLAEMMNYPGVLHQDQEVMAKIAAAIKYNKPVDGHAPGLKGTEAKQYAAAGITTDHECVAMDEALDKIRAGMYILIREGSAAKNFEVLIDLFQTHSGKLMFCSDDKHPDDLLRGHINQLVQRAVKKGYNVFDVLYAACILPVKHYKLDVGLLQENDAADFIVVKDLESFRVLQTYIDGAKVSENGTALTGNYATSLINNFSVEEKNPEDFIVRAQSKDVQKINVIAALDGQLITNAVTATLKVIDGKIESDTQQDILKIGVVNRYSDAPPCMGFVKNFGLKRGAIASSVAHDSHNIVFVGCDDNSICEAVNAIIRSKGGISAYDGVKTSLMSLPVAGLMSDKDAFTAGREYETLTNAAQALGSTLQAPFMTLSFMALPVIPSLKMTDKGLFDVDQFAFSSIFVD